MILFGEDMSEITKIKDDEDEEIRQVYESRTLHVSQVSQASSSLASASSPNNIQSQASTSTSSSTNPSSFIQMATAASSNSIPSERVITSPKQKRSRQMTLFMPNRRSQLPRSEVESLNKSLIKMISVDYQPLSIVENAGLIEFSRKLQPLYNLPNRKLLSSQLLPSICGSAVTKLSGILSNIKHVSVTTDIWTSDSNKSFLTVTCHFVHNSVLHGVVLSTIEVPFSHTALNIANSLEEIFETWKLSNKVVAIVSDNGANIKKAIIEHLRKHHHPCVAHTLNLCVTDSLKRPKKQQQPTSLNTNVTALAAVDQDGIVNLNETLPKDITLLDITKKCRSIVTHFKHSVLTSEKFKTMQNQMGLSQLKVIQDVPTRWNSTLAMMERLAVIKDPLSAVMSSLQNAPEVLAASEWEIVTECVNVLKPAGYVTVELSGQKYVTMSSVIPVIRGLQHVLRNLNPQTPVAKTLRDSLLESVTKRLEILETNKMSAKSTFLDPRFRKTGFGLETNAKNAQQWVSEELATLLDEKTTNHSLTPTNEVRSSLAASSEMNTPSIWDFFDSKAAEVETQATPLSSAMVIIKQYLDLPLIPRNKNPFDFWETYRTVFPELFELATKYLCVPATSVPSERVFSKAGQITNERRNRLKGKNLDAIIFLNSNFSLLE